MDFVKGDDHVGLLSRSSSLGFDIDDEGKAMRAHPLTNDEILACCDDLKVLGKKDFKALLKWRDQIRLALGIDTVRPKEKVEAAALIEEETEESMLDKVKVSQISAILKACF